MDLRHLLHSSDSEAGSASAIPAALQARPALQPSPSSQSGQRTFRRALRRSYEVINLEQAPPTLDWVGGQITPLILTDEKKLMALVAPRSPYTTVAYSHR